MPDSFYFSNLKTKAAARPECKTMHFFDRHELLHAINHHLKNTYLNKIQAFESSDQSEFSYAIKTSRAASCRSR